MSDDRKERARARRVATARELEQRGMLEHAVKTYLRAGAPAEAARALASAGRLADAAAAIIESLSVRAPAQDVAALGAEDRALVE
ncbi:MAG: hypothetical protein KF729_38175, partial [Sandaracinaceae bacterium]|nr:hypothetical protein [Sandaracinaceae bacterium]